MKDEIREYIFNDNLLFESCHASTLAALANGDVIACWFGGSKEGAGDVAIWCAKRHNGKWTRPEKVADEEGLPHWNPVLFSDKKDRISLFYKVGHLIPEWTTRIITSDDFGETWSQPKTLVKGDRGGRGPVKNKPIRLMDGTWLAPASVEGLYWDTFSDISKDEGRTWVKSSFVPFEHDAGKVKSVKSGPPVPKTSLKGKGIIQPSLWQSGEGTVHMLIRSTEGAIYRSDSDDKGLTWCAAYPTSLPNNNSGIDLVRLQGGRLVLAYNPVGENWGARTPLVLSTSEDNGENWEEVCVLEDEKGEYSYPAIIESGNKIMVTYTWNREKIAFYMADSF